MNMELAQRQASTAMVDVESSKGIAEVQASLVIAKRFPRDELAAAAKIERACQRPTLAEQAVYSYSRGGQEVTGPSIRLAEAMAQAWGNIDFGWRELGRSVGHGNHVESTVNAYCWDKETNTRKEQTFTVPHYRDTRHGRKPLTDERDIYELCANQAARRIRSNVLSVIPGDIVDMAVATCRATLETNVDMSPKKVAGLLEGLARYGVTRAQVVKWLGRSIEAMTPAQFVRLVGIGTSLRDGMGKADDFFQPEETESAPQTQAERVAASVKAKARPADFKPMERDPDTGEVIPEGVGVSAEAVP